MLKCIITLSYMNKLSWTCQLFIILAYCKLQTFSECCVEGKNNTVKERWRRLIDEWNNDELWKGKKGQIGLKEEYENEIN